MFFSIYNSIVQYIPEREVRKKIAFFKKKIKFKIGGSKHVFKEENIKIIRNTLKEEMATQEKNTQGIGSVSTLK